VLAQQGAFFNGQTLAYKQAGQVQIEIEGNFQGLQRQTSINIQLITAAPSCQLGQVQCFWRQYQQQILIFTPLILLLLMLLLSLLLWSNQTEPYGWLTDGKFAVEISKSRSLSRRLLSKSIVSSHELQFYPQARRGSFKFNTAVFDLIFKSDGVYVRPSANDRSRISVNRQTPNKQEKEKLLVSGSSIEIDRKEVAKYSTSRPRGYDPQGRKI
jgi:hypothetical protein